VQASETMGAYLAELGRSRTHGLDVLDFGCVWGGEALWPADRVCSVYGVDVDKNEVAQANKACEVSAVRHCRLE
jgi:cyclopropane fatty-acyl-phospholipid synthase-like methyltransferase